jgi:predicted DNA-binding transcriptional regulator AlpA
MLSNEQRGLSEDPHMAKRQTATAPEELQSLHPDQVVRFAEGSRWFGYKETQLRDLIAKGAIPRPFRLSPGGRAMGWLGRQDLEFHRTGLAACE